MHEIERFPLGYFEACCYLIRLPSSTCLIDPVIPPAALPARWPPVKWIIATHGHFDHISHADELRMKTGAPLFIHPADSSCLVDPTRNLSMAMQRSTALQPAESILTDGQLLQLTDGYAFEVLHTPGHTPGGICLLLIKDEEPVGLFTGDTLFAGSIGRLDLGGSPTDMANSLYSLRKLSERLSQFDVPVYPGHGSQTSLHHEVKTNPYFQIDPAELANY